MTPENFAYWLQGFVELTQGQTPNPAQWKSIQEHLGEVFTKVTPAVAPPKVDSKPVEADVQKILREWNERGTQPTPTFPPQPYQWGPLGYPPGTIIC